MSVITAPGATVSEAIERHREAATRFGIAFANLGKRIRSREANAAAGELNAAIAALVTTTTVTTPAELKAWLAYVAEHVESADLIEHLDDFLGALRAAVRVMV